MVLSVSNEGFQWSPDFGPNSVTLTKKDLVQGISMSSQEIPLPAQI